MLNTKLPLMSVKKAGAPFESAALCIEPTVTERHHVIVTFQLPPLLMHYQCKAEDYLAHLVGHEGPGSLLSELKARNWATMLSAGVPPTVCPGNAPLLSAPFHMVHKSGEERRGGSGWVEPEYGMHAVLRANDSH